MTKWLFKLLKKNLKNCIYWSSKSTLPLNGERADLTHSAIWIFSSCVTYPIQNRSTYINMHMFAAKALAHLIKENDAALNLLEWCIDWLMLVLHPVRGEGHIHCVSSLSGICDCNGICKWVLHMSVNNPHLYICVYIYILYENNTSINSLDCP